MRCRFIKQHDAMQCGIASLAMICSHFGRQYSVEYLSPVCYATHEGVSLLGIAQAAKKLGLESLSAKTTVEGILQAPLPCILHWNQNHFVVLVIICTLLVIVCAVPYPYGEGESILRHILAHVS